MIRIIVIFFFFVGCVKRESIAFLSFSPDTDCIGVTKLLNISNQNYLKPIGDYKCNDECVASQFHYKDNFYIDVIKINHVSNPYKFNLYFNQFALKPGFYEMITDNENRLQVLYDSRINKKSKKINKIDLLLSGTATKIPSKNNITSYLLNSDEFCIRLNDNKEKTVSGDMKHNQVILSFYKYNSSIYIFVISLKSGKDISLSLSKSFIDEFFKEQI